MAVTKKFVFFLASVFILSGCAVDLEDSTPGALEGCDPTSTEVEDFHSVVFQGDLKTNCASCHKDGGIGATGYAFRDPDLNFTDEQKLENYCLHFARQRKLLFPTDSDTSHLGGFVAPDLLPNLVAWVNNLSSE